MAFGPTVIVNSTNSQKSPSDPSVTTSLTGVMMGLAGTITPTNSGNVLIIISGDIDNSAAGDGCAVQIRTGTGSVPANGDALTGTARGGLTQFLNPSETLGVLGLGRNQFSLNAVVTGLTLGTAVWIDVSLASVTGGNSRIRNISISAIEV